MDQKITFGTADEAFQYFADEIGALQKRIDVLETKALAARHVSWVLRRFIGQLPDIDESAMLSVFANSAERF